MNDPLDLVLKLEQVFLNDSQLIKTISFVLPAGINEVSFNFFICDIVVDYVLRFSLDRNEPKAITTFSSEDINVDGIENQRRGVILIKNCPLGIFCSKQREVIYTLPEKKGFVDITFFINSYGQDDFATRFVTMSLWHRW